jgi:hypothetical protein
MLIPLDESALDHRGIDRYRDPDLRTRNRALWIVVGMAFLGLAVVLYRRPLVHRIGLSHRVVPFATRFLGILAVSLRLAALHVEPISVGGPEAAA